MKNTMDFSAYAEAYDNRKDFDRILLDFKSRVIERYRPQSGATLELGCAMGLMSCRLLPMATTLDIVDGSQAYVDATRGALQAAFPERVPDVRYFCGLFEEYQPDRAYDTIVLSGALPALEHPVEFLREIRAWLAPGGVLYVTTHNAFSLHRRLGKAMGLIHDEHELSERDITLFGHRVVYDMDSLSADVSAAGYAIQRAGGIFLKPFPNAVMETFTNEHIEGLFAVGNAVPADLCAELYIFAGVR